MNKISKGKCYDRRHEIKSYFSNVLDVESK